MRASTSSRAARPGVTSTASPPPAAGLILVTHHPFSQTPFLQEHLAGLPWPEIMVVVMALVSILMMSHVPYAKMPRIDLKSRAGIARTTALGGSVALAVAFPAPLDLPGPRGLRAVGLLRSVFLGLLDRLPERDPLLDAPESLESAVEPREVDYHELTHEPDARPSAGDRDEPAAGNAPSRPRIPRMQARRTRNR